MSPYPVDVAVAEDQYKLVTYVLCKKLTWSAAPSSVLLARYTFSRRSKMWKNGSKWKWSHKIHWIAKHVRFLTRRQVHNPAFATTESQRKPAFCRPAASQSVPSACREVNYQTAQQNVLQRSVNESAWSGFFLSYTLHRYVPVNVCCKFHGARKRILGPQRLLKEGFLIGQCSTI